MSSVVIGGFCEHSPVIHELVAKFADMAAKETAKEHVQQLKARGHSTPHTRGTAYASGWPLTGAWRDFHENKIARLPYVDPSTEYARTLRHLQAPDTRSKAESTAYCVCPWGLGRKEERAARQRATYRPFGAPPPPAPAALCLWGSGGGALT
jgi:hypothetical protein